MGVRKQRALHRRGQKQLYRVDLSSLQAFKYAKPFGEGRTTEPSENYLEKLFVATRERTTFKYLFIYLFIIFYRKI